jgi:hypothetical protein
MLGKARIHQKHHCISFSDGIVSALVMYRQSGNDNHALSASSRGPAWPSGSSGCR